MIESFYNDQTPDGGKKWQYMVYIAYEKSNRCRKLLIYCEEQKRKHLVTYVAV